MKHWIILFIRLVFGFAIGTFMLNTISYAPYMHIIMKNGFYSAGLFMIVYIVFLALSMFISDKIYEKTNWFKNSYIKYGFCIIWSILGIFVIRTFLTSVQFPLWFNILMVLQLTFTIQEDNDPFRSMRKSWKKPSI